MTYKTVNDVKFQMIFTDSHEEYFYKLALDTLIEEDKLELEHLDGDFLKYLYGFILYMIYVDFSDIVFDNGLDYNFCDLEYPLDESTISIFHEHYLNDNKVDFPLPFDIPGEETKEVEEVDLSTHEYYQRIEELDEIDMLKELIAHFRPIVTDILCEKFSSMKLLYLMYYVNQQKYVLNEESEDYEDFESFDDYLSYVEECIKEQPLTSDEAYSWIEEKMPQRG